MALSSFWCAEFTDIPLASWTQDTGVWLLKNDNHRGQGVRLVPTSEAVQASRASAPNGQQTWKLAQQYIANPLLLDGRKFGIRLHVFIPPGPDPFRVYVHKQGFANLSELKYDKSKHSDQQATLAHITACCWTALNACVH